MNRYPQIVLFTAAVFCLWLTYMLVDYSRQPRAALPLNASAEKFSGHRAWQQLDDILSPGIGHPIGSLANKKIKDILVEKLSVLGLQVQIQKTYACSNAFLACGQVENILAELPGQNPDKAIMLMAHYDSVPVSPGAGDDGAGVAAILETARILIDQGPFANSIIFQFTDGEEAGLLGIEGFLAEHPWAKRVDTVFVLEAGGTSGSSSLLRTSENNLVETGLLVENLQRPRASSTGNEMFKHVAADTDLSATLRQGMAGMDFVISGDRVRYHTQNDSMQYLDVNSIQSHGDNLLPLTLALANMDLTNKTRGQRAFTDVLSRQVLHWPISAGTGLVVLAILFFMVSAWRLRRRFSFTQYASSLLFCIFVMVAGVVLGQLTISGLSSDYPDVKYPAQSWPWLAAMGFTVLFVGIAAVYVLQKYLSAWALSIASWSQWLVLATLLALTAPGAVGVVVFPCLMAGLLLMLFSFLPNTANYRALLFGLQQCLAGVFVFVLSQSLYAGLGISGAVLLLFIFTLVLLGLLPILLPLNPTQGKQAVGSAFLAAVLMIGLSHWLPVFTSSYAQVVNIKHVTDLNQNQSQWQFVHNGQLPAALEGLAEVKKQAQRWYPWPANSSDKYTYAAPAASVGLAGPELIIVNRETVSQGQTMVQARFKSVRGARVGQLLIAQDAGLQRLQVNGIDIDFSQSREIVKRFGDYHSVMLHALDEQPVTLSFAYQGNALPLILMDMSEGIPADGEFYSALRGPDTTQLKEGDSTIMLRRLTL